MADTLKNLFSYAVTSSQAAALTAGGAERITIRRMKVLNIHATTTTTISIWRGGTTDPYAIVKGISLAPGEALDFDPTTIILNAGEILYMQAGVNSVLVANGDGVSSV